MLRNLLTSTAVAAVLTSSALAGTNTTSNTSTETNHPIFNQESDIEVRGNTSGYFEASDDLILASTLLGKTVYNRASEDAENIGDVNDVVMAPDGTAKAVVIGVGGFLGIAEKEVAVDFSRLTWYEHEGAKYLVLKSSSEELAQAPTFVRPTVSTDNRAIAQGADETNADGATTARDGMTVVSNANLSADKLIGARVYGAKDSDLGEIGDVLVSADANAKVEAYIIDVGGFLGIGEKPVALDATQLTIMKDEDGDMYIYTPFTQEQLENHPGYSEKAYKENRDAILVR